MTSTRGALLPLARILHLAWILHSLGESIHFLHEPVVHHDALSLEQALDQEAGCHTYFTLCISAETMLFAFLSSHRLVKFDSLLLAPRDLQRGA